MNYHFRRKKIDEDRWINDLIIFFVDIAIIDNASDKLLILFLIGLPIRRKMNIHLINENIVF